MGNMYDLDSKIAQFIKWYKNNLYDGKYRTPKEIINFIEKIAVWYELRYPEYEITKMLTSVYKEEKDVTEEMFYKNEKINKILNNSNNKLDLTFSTFYNQTSFINSLPSEESDMLREPTFPSIIYIGSNDSLVFFSAFKSPRYIKTRDSHIHFNSDSTVDEIEGIYGIGYEEFKFVGLKAEECEKVLRNMKLLNKKNKLQVEIERYNKELNFRNGLLECVIYRIIDRGGYKIGPKRAFLFAKEFNSNINIPMLYLSDFSTKEQEKFIGDFVKSGGGHSLDVLTKPTNKQYKLKIK